MRLTPSTMKMKSVIAGEYTAPPAQGPRMMLNWGITPELWVLFRKMRAYPSRERTPSWMRAPPESFTWMKGTPFFRAISWLSAIFFGVFFPEGAAEDGEILGGKEDLAVVHLSATGYNAIAEKPFFVQAEFTGPSLDVDLVLNEGSWVQKGIHPIPGGFLAFFPLGLKSSFAAALQ